MSTYARITSNVAVEVWTDGGLGITPADVFVPGLAEQFEPVPGGVVSGSQLVNGQWIAPPEPGPVSLIPQSVTMRRCRIALLEAGLLESVQTSIASMPGADGERARIDWEYALEVRRDWPLIGALGPQMGLTEQQIDDLFIYAATIPQ